MVATRIRDTAFKRVLSRLPDGSQVKISGPFGKMALPEIADQTFVFLVGGIGITPFRSIILDAAARESAHRILLFYANRGLKDAAFIEELIRLEKEQTAYRLISTVTGEADLFWQGERGRIDRGMIERYVDDLRSAVYFVAGPAPMVDGLAKSLEEAGVSSERVHAEKFAGY
jgi:ferredoxin-NADP reductase